MRDRLALSMRCIGAIGGSISSVDVAVLDELLNHGVFTFIVRALVALDDDKKQSE